ncbi:hypothetical protein [Deinococcus yavapaiensis]|uniref:Uncharacterized protein n=1 Tax=Deinococcus yavapaiensis KR-236 TaxID=694435 RepID=A0A318S7L2_9DEIO|nr:hypothetical protein [Deinococcus yavapaiensis]PYE53778.1 hypothetical protein DES52_10736 [Deinococcus yavapaiensis KR-236]
MTRTIRTLALAALTLTTGLASASSVLSYVATYDAQGYYSNVATLDANQNGVTTSLFVPASLLGLDDVSGTDESGSVQLTAITTSVSGVSFDLNAASIASTALQDGMLRVDVIAYSDGWQGNGVYPVVLTLKNTSTGQSVDVQANVVVTNNAE